MKKGEFKQLALLGLTTGLLLTTGRVEGKTDYDKTTNSTTKTNDDNSDPNNSNLGYHLMTEDELLIELNDDGIKMYNSLTPQNKQLTLTVASMRCASTNPCAALNACATDKNDCAGKGKCKGQGKCAISDKNLAVKLVYDKMANKRANSLKN